MNTYGCFSLTSNSISYERKKIETLTIEDVRDYINSDFENI